QVWVTAWRPGGPGELDRYWVARPVDGKLIPSGEVSFGLTPDQASTLRQVLHAADLGDRRRSGLRPVAPVVAMTVASHGRRTGWLRDPIVTALHLTHRPLLHDEYRRSKPPQSRKTKARCIGRSRRCTARVADSAHRGWHSRKDGQVTRSIQQS